MLTKTFCFGQIAPAASVLLVLLIAGCGRPPTHSLPEPPCVSTCDPGQPGGKLTLVIPANPQSFNPLAALDAASDAVTRLLFSPLIQRDAVTQQLNPGLAESWSVDADQKTWTFKLRRGLRWSDGQPLTASDVVFTWNEVMYNPEYNRFTYDLFRIGGTNFSVSQVDELTVRVVTPEVFAPFLEYFGSIVILPRHVLEKAVQSRHFLSAYGVNTRPERMVGSGPFQFKEFEPGRLVRLERNPEFWVVDRQGRRLPYFDEVELLIATDSATALLDLFTGGKSDVFESSRQNTSEALNQAAATGTFKVYDLGPGSGQEFLVFNENTNCGANGQNLVPPERLKWFRNKTFRQAISCALDRERMVKQAFAGRARAESGFVPKENQLWHNAATARFETDPVRAHQLFANIGMVDRDGDGMLEDASGQAVAFTLICNSENAARCRIAALAAEDLQKAGLRVQVQLLSYEALLLRVSQTFDYDAAVMGFGGGGIDPASQINLLKSNEALHQWFPMQASPSTDWEARIDELMNAQMRTLDQSERKRIFNEVQAIWAEQLPMIGLVAPFSCAAARSNLANLRPAATSTYPLTWNVEELFFR